MYKLILSGLLLIASLTACKKAPENPTGGKLSDKSIYYYNVAGLDGDSIRFSDYIGSKILVVNTASECKYTYQYEGLEALYKKYNGRLVIVGFPANDFGLQEPGTNDEISDFCSKNYGVTFPMAAKISVKGDDIAPIYKWLTQKDYNGYVNSTVDWNFQKYLIDENGKLIAIFESRTEPDDSTLISLIEK